MTGILHHFWVTLRLTCTTRGGLVALLALVNCLPMVAMQMFSRHAPNEFAGDIGPVAFVLSLLFIPLARWSLGSILGQRGSRTSALTLPLGPRSRALAEALAVLVGVFIPAAALMLPASMVFADSAATGFQRGLSILLHMGGSLGAMALPHLFLASLDRESPSSRHMWLRWLAAPLLILAGLSIPGTRSFLGYCAVGVAAGAIILARGPSPWIASSHRRLLGARPTELSRSRAASPQAALREDFLRGLGSASLRGLGWGVVLAVPLLVSRSAWSGELLALAGAAIIVVAALVTGAKPLGMSTRVTGSQWQANGSFARAWSLLPIPAVSVARVVYLHTALCSTVALGVCVFVHRYWVAHDSASGGLAGTLLLGASVLSLASIGIRSTTATGSTRAWQGCWLLGGTGAAAAWLSYFLSAPGDHATFAEALQATPAAGVFVVVALVLGVGTALLPLPQLTGGALARRQ